MLGDDGKLLWNEHLLKVDIWDAIREDLDRGMNLKQAAAKYEILEDKIRHISRVTWWIKKRAWMIDGYPGGMLVLAARRVFSVKTMLSCGGHLNCDQISTDTPAELNGWSQGFAIA